MNTNTVTKLAAQGDVMFRRVAALPDPDEVTEVVRGDDGLVVAHSDTGHHHVVRSRHAKMYATANAFVAYLVVKKMAAKVEHLRSWDTHEALVLKPGVWQILRQREHAPEGWRRVAD